MANERSCAEAAPGPAPEAVLTLARAGPDQTQTAWAQTRAFVKPVTAFVRPVAVRCRVTYSPPVSNAERAPPQCLLPLLFTSVPFQFHT
jgi:hypothetical protein